jgi:asparagine synthase (glutamine-hydrolysing)
MCGITGIHGLKNIESRNKYVQQMSDTLTHRGPDTSGFYSDSHCTLSMRRLSIIDVDYGNQPMFSANYVIIFNGEIYNYKEIKEEFILDNVKFNTNSDTEVILKLYEKYGLDCTKYMKGMFAFCIYDKSNHSIFISRDRFGEKPLYYHIDKNNLSFSSEINSLLQNPEIKRNINYLSLSEYLQLGLIREPKTLIENIFSLPPGFSLFYKDSNLKLFKYFNINYNKIIPFNNINDVTDYLDPIMTKAISRSSISDVNYGAFLSGGLDSSTVVSKLAESTNTKVKTFNVKFETKNYDESPIARSVSRYYDTEHTQLYIKNNTFKSQIFWKILYHVGFPFLDSSAIPTYLICKEISKHVKVVISGDGGDELFGGYSIFLWYLKIMKYNKYKNLIKYIYTLLYNLKQNNFLPDFDSFRKIIRFLELSSLDDKNIPLNLNSFINYNILAPHTKFNLVDLNIIPDINDYNNLSVLRQIMHYRLKNNLPYDMLIKTDRMSMANSLEIRSPFLDSDLFNATLTIPDKYFINNNIGKYILRKLMVNKLPSSVFNHPKQGFSIPLHNYINDEYRDLAKDLIFNNQILHNLFTHKFLSNIYQIGLNQKYNNSNYSVYKASHLLWQIMQLSGWLKLYKINI